MESLILPLLLALLFVPLILSFRKQRRQYNELQQLQSSLDIGDRVLTTSGLQATIVDATDDTVDLEIAPGVVTTWVRPAIRERLSEQETELDDEDAEEPAVDEADKR